MSETILTWIYVLAFIGFYGAQPNNEKDVLGALLWPVSIGAASYHYAHGDFDAVRNH